MSRRHRLKWTAVACLAAAALIGGCKDSSHQGTYGTGMAGSGPSSMTMAPPPAAVVPAGATPLATNGTYNQIQFKVPAESGMIYILDQDTGKVVSTNSIASDGGKTMTMPALGNTVQGLSTSDHYSVYFAPSHPTTAPIGGGGGSGM